MAIASSDMVQMAYIAEVSAGTTPLTPALTRMRFTGESLEVSRENITSSELRADRNVSDLIQVGGGAGGSVDFELSYGSHDAMLEGALQGSWTNNVLKNGVTPKSFTLERRLTDVSPNVHFFFRGMHVNGFSLKCATKEIVTGSFEFLGMSGAVAESAISGATYIDATTTDVMDAASGFAGFTVAGLSGVHVSSIGIECTNNLRAPTAAGSVAALGVGSGRFELSGTLEAYFEDSALYEAFLNGNATAIAFTMGRTSGEKYTFSIPRVKFETGTVSAQSAGNDIMASMTFKGLFDPTEECTLKITRAVS